MASEFLGGSEPRAAAADEPRGSLQLAAGRDGEAGPAAVPAHPNDPDNRGPAGHAFSGDHDRERVGWAVGRAGHVPGAGGGADAGAGRAAKLGGWRAELGGYPSGWL